MSGWACVLSPVRASSTGIPAQSWKGVYGSVIPTSPGFGTRESEIREGKRFIQGHTEAALESKVLAGARSVALIYLLELAFVEPLA